MIRGYLFKLARSPLTYIGVFGVLAVCLLNIHGQSSSFETVITRINMFLDLDAFRKITVLFAALPFTANFSDEWKSKITTYCVTRKGVKKYAFSNVFLCFLTSLIALFLGIMLYMLGASLFTEFDSPDPNIYTRMPYHELLNDGPRWLYPVTRVFVFSVSGAMWCVMGLMLSALIPNKYVAVCSPVVASYIVERITMQFPPRLSLYSLSMSVPMVINSTLTFIYTTLFFTGISAICGWIFYIILLKRVRNEFTV